MSKAKMVLGHIMWFFMCVLCGWAFADDATVLPKGISSVKIDGAYYLPIDKRYNHDGHAEDAATDFNANLNSNIFPALGQIEAALGLPAGSASLGTSEVTFKYHFTNVNTSFYYGVTNALSVGVMIPYWWQANDVTANLNTSGATVGKNAALGTLAPLVVPGTVPLTTEDIQQLLGPGLNIGQTHIPGFGFKRIESWSDKGLGDVEAGAKYLYFNNESWRLAASGGMRFPTGKKDDIDNLVDFAFGSGAYALLFRLNNDYVGIQDLVLDATIRYDLTLPFKNTLRIPAAVHEPLTAEKERVNIDYGDTVELEASGTYNLTKALSFGLLYKYGYKARDKVTDGGGHIQSLEDQTDFSEQIFKAKLAYSTIPAFEAKKFSLPLDTFVEYRNRFAGTNNALKSQYIAAGVQAYF